MIVSVKKVNERDYYPLGLKDLPEKIGLNQPRALALVKHLDLQSSIEFFKDVRIGKVVSKRYSQKALEALHAALKTVDMEKVWQLHNPSGKPATAKAGAA